MVPGRSSTVVLSTIVALLSLLYVATLFESGSLSSSVDRKSFSQLRWGSSQETRHQVKYEALSTDEGA